LAQEAQLGLGVGEALATGVGDGEEKTLNVTLAEFTQ